MEGGGARPPQSATPQRRREAGSCPSLTEAGVCAWLGVHGEGPAHLMPVLELNRVVGEVSVPRLRTQWPGPLFTLG